MVSVDGRPINEHELLAHQVLSNSSPFIKAVTELADKREVLANEDIYSRNGIKLISKGKCLSGKFYDRLIEHKLLKPIELSVNLSDALDPAEIVSLAYSEAHRIPSLAPLLSHPKLLDRMKKLFDGISLPGPLALKLSVMQEDRPKLFQHSLIVSMIAMILGVRNKMPRKSLQALALASIFHDIGELCIDPATLASSHRMTNDERRYLFTHPITGFLMLRDFKELPKGTADAVLQHHERMDGSGYPNRNPGKIIHKLARYLAVAEFVASLLERDGADKRISMKLRLNLGKFDSQAVALVCQLFDDSKIQPSTTPDENYLISRLTQAGKLFESWARFRDPLSPADIEDITYLVDRLDGLRMMVLEPGFDQCRLEDLLPMAGGEDTEIRVELSVLLDELAWQFQALSREIERKIFVHGWSLHESRREAFNQWFMQVRQFTGEEA